MAEEKARDPTKPEIKPVSIPLSKIHDLPGSVFAPPSQKSLEALTSSIVLKGVQEPVILRQREDGEFQIVSGNRRRKASEFAKKTEIPAFVYDMGEREAKAVYCNNATQMPAVVVARVDDAVKVIYDRDSTLAVIDTIKVRITERAKQHKETEVIFYDVSGLREAQKQLNAIVADNQIALTAPAHLYALVGEAGVKAEFVNNSKSDTYKVEIRRNKDNALIADAFELAAGKSISSLTLLEAPEFGNTDCTVTITAFRDGKQIGTLNTELTLHTAYLWPKEVQ